MIQQNNNMSVLPFYTDLGEQDHRRSYAYGDIYPLYTPLGSVPPFQIVTEPTQSAPTVSTVSMVRKDGGGSVSVKSQLVDGGLRVMHWTDYNIVLYPSLAPMNITTTEGQYYLIVIMSTGEVFYSDVFTVVGDASDYLFIQWWDEQDFIMDASRIVYKDSNGNLIYKNTLMLNTQLGKPEYEFEEEGEKRDMLFFAEKMLSAKKYKCHILANEPLLDVMRFIRLSDYIQVKDKFDNQYNCDTFLFTPKWETQGNLASVEIEFTTATVAKKIGRAFISGTGDYNDDYNNDYDN